MHRLATASPFESGPLRETTGTAIRPGGTRLTSQGVEFCGFAPGSELLDVGCGAGATVEFLRESCQLNAVGIDPSLRLLEEAWERNPELPLGLGTAQKIPFADESKDGIICECVLSLLDDPEHTLAEFQRVLRPGGYLILSDLYDRRQTADDRRSGVLSRIALEEMLRLSGFCLLLWEDRSRLLKELAARLVLAHGTVDDLWCAAGGWGDGLRAGYFLLVARKI